MTDHIAMKARLEAEQVELEKSLTELGVSNPQTNADWIATPTGTETGEADPNIGADRVEDWNERRGEVAMLETRYNNVKRALAKIAAGTYGVCEISGEPIEADRLEANPAARTCKAHLDDEADLPA